SSEYDLILSCKSAGNMLPPIFAGGAACIIVHGLDYIGRISGESRRSSSVGCQTLPRGGAKIATDFSSFAKSVVVNLASSDGCAQIGGVVNASLANSGPILP